MAPIPKGGTVAVTGSAGFIGGWVVRRLLERGYRVRACVRDTQDADKVGFLKALPGYASGRLTLHSADLDTAGSFDEAFAGAHGVCHVSHITGAPAPDREGFSKWNSSLRKYSDQEYIAWVCQHLMDSINKSGTVSRVVVTSSIAAVMSEVDLQEIVKRPVLYEDRYPDESNPRRVPEKGQGYSMGKVLAERLFAEGAIASGSRWDAIACCPGDNIGPIQSRHQKDGGPWQHNIENMLLGLCEQNGAYRPWFTVDVRDDADCHIGLLESGNVRNGERYIAWSTDSRKVEDICKDIDRLLPELAFEIPAVTDSFRDDIKAREAEFRKIWALCDLRNERMRAAIGITFRSLDDSIRDCVESLMSIGGVVPVRRSEQAPSS
jgi:dihydroflavonol-4-reductase